MTLGTLFNVRVEKPRSAIAATMNQMRAWLDAQKVQPATLKVAPTDNGVVFGIRFEEQYDAMLFQQRFA